MSTSDHQNTPGASEAAADAPAASRDVDISVAKELAALSLGTETIGRIAQLLERAAELAWFSLPQPSEAMAALLLAEGRLGEIRLLRAPGRINLIGEHTDYNNCPVLPMAVNREILAVSIPNADGIFRIADVDPKYGTADFSLEEYIPQPPEGPAGSAHHPGKGIPPFPTGHWGNYFKASVNEMIALGNPISRGFSLVFSSTIPPAAGMSSSSALVVLSALAAECANGRLGSGPFLPERRLELAELCRTAEWYTGTMGGGMDQAAILCSAARHAVKIDFAPLRVRPVSFPEGFAAVVAHSTVEAPKTREAMDLYNRRSIECRIAAAAAGSELQRRTGIQEIAYIGDLTPEKTGYSREQLTAVLSPLFHPAPYSTAEAAELVGIPSRELTARLCRRRDGSLFPEPSDGFKLYQRFRHIWEEWDRVEASVDLLKNGDMEGFGRLMNESHASCRDLHEISCPELDLLTSIARESGALGSRLTGAGFGGCSVNLLPRNRVKRFMEALTDRYYCNALGLTAERARRYLFVVEPADGAGPV